MASPIDNRALALVICLALTSCAAPGLTRRNSEKRIHLQPGSADSIVYAALGDSTGTGLGARNGAGYVELLFTRIQQVRPGSRLVNLSTAWATSADVLKNQIGKLADSRPSLVTVGIGINDVLQGVREEDFEANYDQIISELEKVGAVTIVMNLADFSAAPMLTKSPNSDVELRIRDFNQCIARVASRHNLKLVDLYTSTRETIHSHPELFSADGMHPSDAGYKLWADTMWPSIKQAIE